MIFLLLSNKLIVLVEKSSARLTVLLFVVFCSKWSAFIIVGKNSRILAPEEILLVRAERQC